MYKVVVVDDETIVRFTLQSMSVWEKYGFQIQADFSGGEAALAYIRENPVDLLITDMKMPGMDGLQLMEQLRLCQRMPVTIVLSGYNEYKLVREAFRLGAYDYLLKEDLNEDNLKKLLKALEDNIFVEEKNSTDTPGEKTQPDTEWMTRPDSPGAGVVLFQVDEMEELSVRFGKNLEESFCRPLMELARQIPRVAQRSRIQMLYPSRYLLLYEAGNLADYHRNIKSVVKQLQSVWREFMNLKISAGISEAVKPEEINDAVQETEQILKLVPLKGKASVCTRWEEGELLERLEQKREDYVNLVSTLYSAQEMEFEQEKQKFFDRIRSMELKSAVQESLCVIALLAEKFSECEDDFYSVYPKSVNYYERISPFLNIYELELWMNNYFGWILAYIEKNNKGQQADVMMRARRFIAENYSNAEMTLKSAADYVGLNEKYFSSRFTKETGNTFSNYLMDVRMQKAKKLMQTTDLKMYEISDQVGYQNVEHFSRLFKRVCGVSPAVYKKNINT